MEPETIPLQAKLDQKIGADHCFDIKKRFLKIGGKSAFFTFIIGYTDSVLTERIFSSLQQIREDSLSQSMEEITARLLPFASTQVTKDMEEAAAELLRGSGILIIEEFSEFLIIDVRSFSLRGTEEPDKDRTLRGPHVGLNESLIANTVQIRRFLRTGDLVTKKYLLGTKIPTEAALLYLKGRGNEKIIASIEKKLNSFSLPSLSMTQETLAATLFPQKGLSLANPFPRVRYTERPDVVAASLMEGKIAILCDNSPSVMLLPECIFDFFEEADDYYFPPVTATYLRIVRSLVFAFSVFLIPLWLLAVKYEGTVPASLSFLLAEEGYTVPLFLQFLIIEISLDGLKMASLNTPSTLSSSFSVIGGLLLGEFAVKSGWFVPQTILYSAFTGIAGYVPTNYELGYSFKFMRMTLVLLVEFFGLWGFLFGLLLWTGILISTRSAAGRGYLYPFFPWDKKAVLRLFVRHTKGKEQNAP